jgi:hypothetical protein
MMRQQRKPSGRKPCAAGVRYCCTLTNEEANIINREMFVRKLRSVDALLRELLFAWEKDKP